MSGDPAPALRQVRRGDDVDELHFLDSAGTITIVIAYGLTPDEKIRVRETALRLIRDALSAEPVPTRGP